MTKTSSTREKVLVVDDDAMVRLLAREALEQAGFSVMVKTRGKNPKNPGHSPYFFRRKTRDTPPISSVVAPPSPA